jgi:hypothetical protein
MTVLESSQRSARKTFPLKGYLLKGHYRATETAVATCLVIRSRIRFSG